MLYADDVVMSLAGYAQINPTPQMDWLSGTSVQHFFVLPGDVEVRVNSGDHVTIYLLDRYL